MAAARQKEMNDNITVVATITFVRPLALALSIGVNACALLLVCSIAHSLSRQCKASINSSGDNSFIVSRPSGGYSFFSQRYVAKELSAQTNQNRLVSDS